MTPHFSLALLSLLWGCTDPECSSTLTEEEFLHATLENVCTDDAGVVSEPCVASYWSDLKKCYSFEGFHPCRAETALAAQVNGDDAWEFFDRTPTGARVWDDLGWHCY